MKTVFGSAVIIPASLIVAACANAPLRQSTSEFSSATNEVRVRATPTVVLPVPKAGNPAPAYPAALLRDGTPATLSVVCLVDDKGRVIDALIRDSNHAAFNDVTLAAVRQWTFQPGTRDGTPATMQVIVPVEFVPRQMAAP